MTYANSIINKLGGIRKAARLLGFPTSTVQAWKKTGFIPARRQSEVLAKARAAGIPLSEQDFFTPSPTALSEGAAA